MSSNIASIRILSYYVNKLYTVKLSAFLGVVGPKITAPTKLTFQYFLSELRVTYRLAFFSLFFVHFCMLFAKVKKGT